MPKFKKNGASQLLGDKNSEDPLSGVFDTYNGDDDTLEGVVQNLLEKFVKEYLKRYPNALNSISLKNVVDLCDVLERMFPQIREIFIEETLTPQKLQQYMIDLIDKKTPKPIP